MALCLLMKDEMTMTDGIITQPASAPKPFPLLCCAKQGSETLLLSFALTVLSQLHHLLSFKVFLRMRQFLNKLLLSNHWTGNTEEGQFSA